jgi:hypothetical protein
MFYLKMTHQLVHQYALIIVIGGVKTYPQVSQFWTFDPKKFIEQPVFSRDFPPSQNLE